MVMTSLGTRRMLFWTLLLLTTTSSSLVVVNAFSVENPQQQQQQQTASSTNARVFVGTPTSNYPKKLVRDYMTSPVPYMVTSETLLDDAMQLFLRHGITGAPVVSTTTTTNDALPKVVGMISSFDFLQQEAFEGSLLPMEGSLATVEHYVQAAQRICGKAVADVMTVTNVFSCTPETPMRQAAAIMSEHRLHRLPVVLNTDSMELVGMLTAEHVLKDLAHLVQSLPPATTTTTTTTNAADSITNAEGEGQVAP